MMNVPENELFSAYLDGELTAAEQAEVERLLATSPAARQLLEDLRALSSTLQCLPAHRLDEDLSRQVLRLAEHRMLSGQVDSQPLPREPIASASRWRTIARRLSRPRIWIWPGVAVAVSLLLMVLHPEQAQRFAEPQAERHVALAPAAAPRAAPESLAIGTAEDADRNGGAERPKIVLSAERTLEESVERPTSLSDALAEVKKDVAMGRVSNVPLREPAPAAAKMVAAKEPSSPAATSAASATPPPARPMKAAVTDLPADVRPAKEGAGPTAEKAPEEVTVVYCDVTSETIALELVEQALARRQVVLLGRPTKDGSDRRFAFGGAGARPRVEMQQESKFAAREEEFAAPGDKRIADSEKEDSGRIVYLRAEATPAQLDAVLADLRSRPEMVRSLSRESRAAGAVAFGNMPSFFFGKSAPVMKQKGDGAPGETSAEPSARRGAAGVSQRVDSLENLRTNVQNRPAETRSAGGARGADQAQAVQGPPGMANTVQSDSATNRARNVQVEQRASGKLGQEGQDMFGPMRQRPIDASQATGTRAAGPGRKQAERRDREEGRQTDEGHPRDFAGTKTAPAQQAMPAAPAGAAPGYRAPSAPMPQAKSLSAASAYAKGQSDVKRTVVFVLRAVGQNPIAAEKASKADAAAKPAATPSK
jgi:hypothetical protein